MEQCEHMDRTRTTRGKMPCLIASIVAWSEHVHSLNSKVKIWTQLSCSSGAAARMSESTVTTEAMNELGIV